MRISTLLMTVLATVLLTACGSDEPEPTPAVIQENEFSIHSPIGNSDVALDDEGRLVSESVTYFISKCEDDAATLETIDIQRIAASLNKRMTIKAGNIYAIVAKDDTHSFPSGKVAVKRDADVLYVAVDELRPDAMRCHTMLAHALPYGLPQWDSTIKCSQVNHSGVWTCDIPTHDIECQILLGSFKITTTTNKNGSLLHLSCNYYNEGVDFKGYDKSNIPIFAINTNAYVRRGTVFTHIYLKE
ncbi:MAG: DUF5036 family protein [Muribaculaceae bacterium]|nr:DUF5036 family protein [Muribaculaceae bacterium]